MLRYNNHPTPQTNTHTVFNLIYSLQPPTIVSHKLIKRLKNHNDHENDHDNDLYILIITMTKTMKIMILIIIKKNENNDHNIIDITLIIALIDCDQNGDQKDPSSATAPPKSSTVSCIPFHRILL